MLTPAQAAQALGVTVQTVRRWIRVGALPAERVGWRWRLKQADVDAMRSHHE